MPRVGERRPGLTERIHLWVLAARWDPGSVYKSSSGSDLANSENDSRRHGFKK